MSDFIADLEAFLADPPSEHLDTIADLAVAAVRRRNPHSGTVIVRPGLFQEYRRVSELTSEDLVEIARCHRIAAAELLEDARDLEAYARDLEEETDLGCRLAEHMAAMRDEHHARNARHKERYEVARSVGGVLNVGLPSETGWMLVHAGLLTLADVAAADGQGRVQSIKGIGPARYRQIQKALDAAAEEA